MKEFKGEDIMLLGGSHDGRGPKSLLFFPCSLIIVSLELLDQIKMYGGGSVSVPWGAEVSILMQYILWYASGQFASTEDAIIVGHHQRISVLKRIKCLYNFVLFIQYSVGHPTD
jgi:hypothetical protein